MLDRVEAEAKRVREFGLRHTQSITDRLHVNVLGHVRFESLLLPGKKSLNVVKAAPELPSDPVRVALVFQRNRRTEPLSLLRRTAPDFAPTACIRRLLLVTGPSEADHRK